MKERPVVKLDSLDLKHNSGHGPLTIKSLCDGRINKHMIDVFYYALMSDYLTTKKVYDSTDFSEIRSNTIPTKISSRGTVSIDSKLHPSANINELEVSPIIPYPSESHGKREIYIPKGITCNWTNVLESAGYYFIPKALGDTPQVIKDLKSVINANTIHNNKNLNININKFNKALQSKLTEMNN
jgi:hypothetical protein